VARFFRKSKSRPAQRKAQAEDLHNGLVTVLDPTNAASEAYRSLRTNLLYAFVDNPPKTILVTSPGPGEGKSTTCANLGVVLSQAAKSTLILDCDFRKPRMHELFGLRNLHGVVDVLVGERSLQEVWEEPVEGLLVVPAGPIPPNPAELLGSNRFAQFLHRVSQEYDHVLIDTAPVGPVADPAILATLGDGVLLVFDARNTRKGELRQSVRRLEAVGANILGTVMNNVELPKGSYYYGYSYR
jgi:capsular exopolysaccharide synthesis family protein